MAEFEVYSRAPGDDLYIIRQGERPVGFTGFLADASDDEGFLIGPVVSSGVDRGTLAQALTTIEAIGSARFARLIASVVVQNERSIGVLEDHGWARKNEQLELKRPRGQAGVRAQDPRLSALVASDDAGITAAAALLQRALGWSDDARERLRRSIDSGVVLVAWSEGARAAGARGPL